ncbi:unnamed protein product [Nippostrongylus brasiliensis]|uniref:N(4)-(Beta-N-acetylglucosaminyl)-L-asparaginase n=1 Tax=Nippostrongylus brasiliensis TaxID=27835 RepID=A0A0N4Y3N8_NIPBR|nr:unnamed protein product [Nippostrongylus brasiliensis]
MLARYHSSILLAFLSSTSYASIPIVVSTWATPGFLQANQEALNALPSGRVYALVEGLSTCERLQCDTTVGFGGSPDETGETTLDALVLDGKGIRMGAVANLHRIKSAARVAWAVMNYTKHSMLVGEAATTFAKQVGFHEENLTTEASVSMLLEWKSNKCQPNFWQNVSPDPSTQCGPYTPKTPSPHFHHTRSVKSIDRYHHDTLGMVIVDETANIPGRVGDSPIVGAGAYAVSGVGGAAATGDGDLLMRFLPSFYVVEQMRIGTKPFKACHKIIRRILEDYPKFQGAIVAANAGGTFGAACANMKKFEFSVGERGKSRTETVPCLHSGLTKEPKPSLNRQL